MATEEDIRNFVKRQIRVSTTTAATFFNLKPAQMRHRLATCPGIRKYGRRRGEVMWEFDDNDQTPLHKRKISEPVHTERTPHPDAHAKYTITGEEIKLPDVFADLDRYFRTLPGTEVAVSAARKARISIRGK